MSSSARITANDGELRVSRLDRRHPNDVEDDQRSRSQRDRDRVLYSSHFRRLAGITQVISPNQLHVVHNRLTHSLEVAQIARRLSQYLQGDPQNQQAIQDRGGLDLDVVETAALAHDLGHPPFGHVAEEQLQESSLGNPYNFEGAFNGNAQSFRILTKLSVRRENFMGLNLTRASLNAVLKYPWVRTAEGDHANHWGAYFTETEDFIFARGGDQSNRKSLEAEIIDWADDVAYAVHDLEDFTRVGIIPLDRLATSFEGEEPQRFYESSRVKFTEKGFTREEISQAYEAIFEVITISNSYRGLRTDRIALRNITSSLIREFIGAFGLNEEIGPEHPRANIDRRIRARVELLKRLTWFYVIDSASLSMQQQGHKQVIKFLFDQFAKAAHDGGKAWKIFPESHRERLEMIRHAGDDDVHMDNGLSETKQYIRLVVDYIASMTEAQALEIYSRLSGTSLRDALEPITY